MKLTEILRLVWLNLSANKSKVILTSTGIIVGAATIMLVIAIGTGGREEVAEQFRNLNAGAIDITYEYQGSSARGSDGFGGGMPGGSGFGGGLNGGGGFGGGAPAGGGIPSEGGIPSGGMFMMEQEGRSNTERITLSSEDMEDLETFVPGIENATMSFSTTASVDGGELESSATYTIAGVQSNYARISNLEMALGDFLTEENDSYKDKVCILGIDVAKTVFGSVYDAYDSTVYIDNRPYKVSGILSEMGTVASGISPDDAIFIPYNTGIKYLSGSGVSPTVTVIAEDVNEVETVITNVKAVLAESYPNAEFTISDAGSKMEAASKSNDTLTMLLICMAVIVFIVGGIGICKRDILVEFLMEASCTSMVGAVLGVMLALGITPVLEHFGVRVELSAYGAVLSLVFGVLTGTLFGFYPAYQASNLIPVVALNHE